jgi:hypothetical protein
MQANNFFQQFHPVIYMIKLNIEMSMAALIGKIARSSDGSTPSGPSTDGIKMSLTPGSHGHGDRKARSRTKSKTFGNHAESGYLSADNDAGKQQKKRFNPTVSEIMAGDGDGERMYHAWVSTDAAGREQSQAQGRGGWRVAEEKAGVDAADEEKGYITKQTQVHVQVAEDGLEGLRKREPSEDGSTTRLRP